MWKYLQPLSLVLAAALLAGCGTPQPAADADTSRGRLLVQLRKREKEDFKLEKPATVYADGVLLGSCGLPGEVSAELGAGPHQVTIEIPWAWQFSQGVRQRAIALTGEQTVQIEGRGKTQVLIFDPASLHKKSLAD